MFSAENQLKTCKGVLNYSPRLVVEELNFYDLLALAVRNNVDMPTAEEEHELYIQKTTTRVERLKNIEVFEDYFECVEHLPAFAFSLTALRLDKKDLKKHKIGQKIPYQVIQTDVTKFVDQIKDPSFRTENWRDIINEVNKVVADNIYVPYCRGQIVREMHPLGIPLEVENTPHHSPPYALHAWIGSQINEYLDLKSNSDYLVDPISGNYDFAISRTADYLHPERCLRIVAGEQRSTVGSNDSFRPVVRSLF